jgi:hypothetical protein
LKEICAFATSQVTMLTHCPLKTSVEMDLAEVVLPAGHDSGGDGEMGPIPEEEEPETV